MVGYIEVRVHGGIYTRQNTERPNRIVVRLHFYQVGGKHYRDRLTDVQSGIRSLYFDRDRPCSTSQRPPGEMIGVGRGCLGDGCWIFGWLWTVWRGGLDGEYCVRLRIRHIVL
jgi:hypothetical protein